MALFISLVNKCDFVLGTSYENTESIEQSNYCLDQIKMNMGK